MNDLIKGNKSKFSFSQPATYQIRVLGKVPESYAERISGMAVTYQESKEKVITTLIGELRDQAALSGILNSLYELHMTVLSVENISN